MASSDDYLRLIEDYDDLERDSSNVDDDAALEIVMRNGEIVGSMVILKNAGAPIDKPMSIGMTPLFYAIVKKKFGLARYMIGIGASIFAPATIGDPKLTIVDAVVKERMAGDKQFREYMASLVAGSVHSKVIADAAQREATIKAAAVIFAARGPLCDTEGYHQHQGECWNDLTQMMLTFTDGLKETVQTDLLTKTGAEIVSRTVGTEHERLAFYIDTLRHRFARHYINESERRTTCAAHGSLRAHGLNALAGAIAMKRGDRPYKHVRPQNYVAGGPTIPTLQLLLTMFKLNVKMTAHEVTQNANMQNTLGCVMQYSNKDSASGHVNGFYTCGGNDYWFDNNLGVFQMPWRSVFRLQKGIGAAASWSCIRHTGLKYEYYPALWVADEEVYVYYDVQTRQFRYWSAANPDKHAGISPKTAMTAYTTIDVVGELPFGPAREPNRPPVTGRGAHTQAYYDAAFEMQPSPVPSEEMPGLASLSPSPTKPFLLTRNANGTLRRLRRGEKATIRRRTARGQKGSGRRR